MLTLEHPAVATTFPVFVSCTVLIMASLVNQGMAGLGGAVYTPSQRQQVASMVKVAKVTQAEGDQSTMTPAQKLQNAAYAQGVMHAINAIVSSAVIAAASGVTDGVNMERELRKICKRVRKGIDSADASKVQTTHSTASVMFEPVVRTQQRR